MRLTAHFTSEEFRCHDGTPAPHHSLGQLRSLCRDFLEPLRDEYGPVTIVSGYRTPEHNRRVGGAPRSYHVYQDERQGVAADVRCKGGTPRSWYRTLDRLSPGGLGSYIAHVHVDNRPGRARW